MSLVDFILWETNVCDRYSGRLRDAVSKRDVAAMLDVNVCEWLAVNNVSHGMRVWLLSEFSPFINGRFVNDGRGYTASVWCPDDGLVDTGTDVACILGCGGTEVVVSVPDNSVRRVFVSGCRVHVALGENSRLYVDATEDCLVDEVGGVRLKRINSV